MTTPLPFGPVMIDVAGLSLTTSEVKLIQHPNTGAVILFSRNYQNPEQLIELISTIRAARNGPILIAVDHEGGRVQRFRSGFTRLPPAACYSSYPELAKPAGWLMAAELLSVGVDFSFAPVLDIDSGISEIIGDRAFSNNSQQVARLASLFRSGMKAAGMAATGKHFPGHGSVAQDSHLALPVDERDFAEIESHDLLPFKQLIDEGLEAIMPAHVLYPKVDSQPAGFSSVWVQQILRTHLGFNGVVFSDDLSMAGAAGVGDFPARAKAALLAGCDMLLVCNNSDAAEQVLNTLIPTDDPIRTQRLILMQGKHNKTRTQLLSSSQWQNITNRLHHLNENYA